MDFFLISFKKAFVYRVSVVFELISSVFSILIQIALWKYLYASNTEMIKYMTAYTIISNIIKIFYSKKMADIIADKVSKGTFAIDLIKPINFFSVNYFSVLGEVVAKLIIRALPICIVFLPTLIKVVHINNYLMPILGVIAVILGHFLNIILYALLGFMAFKYIEIWPFSRVLSDTIRLLSGAFIPLSLFPKYLKTISDVLPFKFLYSFPLRLILGNIQGIEILQNFFILAVWLMALILLLILIYNKAIDKCTVQGG